MFDFNSDSGLIRAYGVIGDQFDDGVGPTQLIEALDAMGGRDVTLQLQTRGGDVPDGISMFNQLKQYGGKVAVRVDSLSASIGTVVMLGGDSVAINDTAQLFVHDPWTAALGNAAEFRVLADALDKLGAQIADIYAAKSGGKRADWLEIMANETYFDPTEAKEIGLIDSIVPVASSPTRSAAAQLRPVAIAGVAFPQRAALQTKVAATRLRLRS